MCGTASGPPNFQFPNWLPGGKGFNGIQARGSHSLVGHTLTWARPKSATGVASGRLQTEAAGVSLGARGRLRCRVALTGVGVLQNSTRTRG